MSKLVESKCQSVPPRNSTVLQFSLGSPDLLINSNVVVGGQTDQQSRTQFSLWTLLPAPLIISSNLSQASSYALETWGNEEVSLGSNPRGTDSVESFLCSLSISAGDRH